MSVLRMVQVTNFLQLHPHHPNKDFAKYDFFQILSIVYVSLSPATAMSNILIAIAGAVYYCWSTWAPVN